MSTYTSKYFQNGEQLDQALLNAMHAVSYAPQTLTEPEKAQTRKNIGAVGFEETTSRNIADVTWVNGQFRDGVFVDMTNGVNNAAAKEYIPVMPQTNYAASCVSVPSGVTAIYIQQYDADKNWLGDQRQYGFTKLFVFTTVENTKYIRVSTYTEGVTWKSTIPEKFQIELGAEPTNYVKPGSTFDGAGAVLYRKQTLTEPEKAQARKNIGIDGVYELIETITVTEAMSIQRSQEPDGTPYKFKGLWVFFRSNASEQATLNLYIYNSNKTAHAAATMGSIAAGNTATRYAYGRLESICGLWRDYWHTWGSDIGASAIYGHSYRVMANMGNYDYIGSILTSTAVAAGTTVEIWGLRA